MSRKHHKYPVHKSEEGIVAILVTMIIMIVLSLVVTGFAQLARREQRAALDNQLNAQAFYAAESGVNDARLLLANGYSDNKDTCDNGTLTLNPDVSGDGVIKYSCVLIKNTLGYTTHTITEDNSVSMSLHTYNNLGDTSVPADKFVFTWFPEAGNAFALPVATYANFPARSGWGATSIALLRIDIIPVPGTISPSSLADAMFTVFAYPTSSGTGQVVYNAANNGSVQQASCDSATGSCVLTVSGLTAPVPAVSPTGHYYVRLRAIYNGTTVKTEVKTSSNDSLTIKGAQAEIDSTGKANDVLKRIKVRVQSPSSDLSGMTVFPQYTTDSKDAICKKLEVWPGGPTSYTCTP